MTQAALGQLGEHTASGHSASGHAATEHTTSIHATNDHATSAPTAVESAFAVDDMFCGGCAATVERAVRRLPGVQDVNVSFLGDTAIVQHDAELIQEPAIREAISRLGYNTRAVNDKAQASQASRFERQLRIRLGVAVGFGLWVMMSSMVRLFIGLPTETLAWSVALFSGIVSIPVLTYSAAPFLKLGWLGLRERVPGMDSLILVATVAAVAGSIVTLTNGGSHVWFDVPVMLVIFQLFARLADFGVHRKASNAVRALLDLSPVKARRVTPGHQSRFVSLAELQVGDLVQSHAGERLCMDGVVTAGAAHIDTGLLNGESLPVHHQPGDAVFAGTLNIDGVVTLRIDSMLGQRRMDVLASAVGRLLNRKSNLMKLADNVAFWLVPLLMVVAAGVMVFMVLTGSTTVQALERALAVLVVSCPCALSLAVPFVVSVAAARAAREGIVLRDASALENARQVDTVLIDKTGTLTLGKPEVVKVNGCDKYSSPQVLALAAKAGQGSHHPLMQAIRVAAVSEAPGTAFEIDENETYREYPGKGVGRLLESGEKIIAGSQKFLEESGVEVPEAKHSISASEVCASQVCVALNDKWVGSIYLADELRSDAVTLIDTLREQKKNVMLISGDRPEPVSHVAQLLGIEWRAQCSPEDKAALVEQLSSEGRVVAFVGDGLNDGPALAAAAVGIATGKASDLAKNASALAVMEGGLDRIVSALRLASKASSVLRSNLAWALLYNSLLLPAAVLGYVHPIMAVVAMGLSTLSVSLNSLRAAR